MYKRIVLREYREIIQIEESFERQLRKENKLKRRKVRTNKGLHNIQYKGVLVWENIPMNIRSLDSFGKFKKEYKKWLIREG